MQKKINTETMKPGQIASWVYEVSADTFDKGFNKGGRAGMPENPLYGRVSARKVYSGQVATHEMYERAAKRMDSTWQPDKERTPRFEATENPFIVRSLASGEFQVRILNPQSGKVEYFVDGRPATPDEIATIEMHRRTREENPNRVKIMFPYVSNIANLQDPQ